MVSAAASELVWHLPAPKGKLASLLPTISKAHHLSRLIARAVGKRAIQEGQA
jgi:hypothetical protein